MENHKLQNLMYQIQKDLINLDQQLITLKSMQNKAKKSNIKTQSKTMSMMIKSIKIS